MKTKKIVTAIIAILVSYNLSAQLNYGVHAGLNLVTQSENGKLWNNCDLYQGFLLGGLVEYKPFNILSFQAELNFQKKGRKVISETGDISEVLRRELDYITVPLLLRATIKDDQLGDKYNITFFGGPYVGYMVSSSARIHIGDETSPVEINQLENLDYGAVFGTGLIYKLNNGKAIIGELRYEMGMASTDKADPDLRNKGIGITAGYRF
jgi:hypothetical protein